MQRLIEIQIGKNGVTENFIASLKNHFKNHKNVKIHVLKSAGHDKRKILEMSEEILDGLGDNYSKRVIGFTIVLKKSKKSKG